MTDGKMVKVLGHIYRLNEQIKDLMDDALLNHPNGEALVGEMQENGMGYGYDCHSIAYSHLVHPERWEYSHRGPPRWKAAKAAGGKS